MVGFRKAAAEKQLGKGQMEELTNTLSSLVEVSGRLLVAGNSPDERWLGSKWTGG